MKPWILQLPDFYIREYKSFIYSHYLSEGVRITIGVVLPAVILSYFNMLEMGIVASLGAICVSIPDTPGPIHHRKNSMIAVILLATASAFITGLLASSSVLIGIWITLACFVFSMIGVFGARTMAIGTAALLVIVLNIDEPRTLSETGIHALLIFAGGTWYALLSLILYSIRPYKLSQQALGDCILSTADYLRVKASFYDANVNYENSYKRLLEQQIHVHESQNLVREMLFKTRNIVTESTPTGRILVMTFLDVVDLFERAMTSHQDYNALHKDFDQFKILPHFQSLILQLADELDRIGIAMKSGFPSTQTDLLQKKIEKVEKMFFELRDKHRDGTNVEGFISLRHILDSIDDIAGRIYTLHQYTTYDHNLSKEFKAPVDYDKFISHQSIDAKLLLSNLTFRSNSFRHAIRISIAALTGYLVAQSLSFKHSYWILLTIIVILKPAFSLTQKRNYERLGGTVAGAVIGLLILYFIRDRITLFVIMILLMIGTYSFMRFRYLLSVILMTPYILLLFHLLYYSDFQSVIYERVIDTAIGFVIAFIANHFLVPAWEHTQIRTYMIQAIRDNKVYFNEIAGIFAGNVKSITEFKLVRKKAFVSLANLSDAFNRMLSEPSNQQKNAKQLHQFVVMNHMLTSHVATISYYRDIAPKYQKPVLGKLRDSITRQLQQIEEILEEREYSEEQDMVSTDETLKELNKEIQELKEIRARELEEGTTDSTVRKTLSEYKPIADQFNFIARTVSELQKNVSQF